MKPRSIPKRSKTKLQESHVDDGQSKTSKNGLKTVTEPNAFQNKPLLGKVFYLDLPFNRKTDTLEEDIKILGGTIEKFFSKDIKYLVSNQKEARYIQNLGPNSPLPSTADSGHSSPHPSSHRGSHKGSSHTVITSRGKALVQKVIKKQERIQINRILSNALEWGIKVLYIDDVISYIEKKRRDLPTRQESNVKKIAKARTTEKAAFQKCDAGRIIKPFVKVEDYSRHYRPIYLSVPHLPELNLTSSPPRSPFLAVEHGKDSQGKKLQGHRGQIAAGREVAPHLKAKSKALGVRAKRRGGYCECCAVKYEDVKTHLNSEQHKAFSKSEEYHVLDRATSELACRFVEIGQPSKRPKCSVSSVVLASGAWRSFERRREGWMNVEHSVEDGTGASLVCPSTAGPTTCSADGTGALRLRTQDAPFPSSSQGSEAPKKPQISMVSKPQDNREHNLTARHTQDGLSVSNPGKLSVSNPGKPSKDPTHIDGELVNKITCPDLLSPEEDLQCFLPHKSLKIASSQRDVTTPPANHTQEPLLDSEQGGCQSRDASQEKALDTTGYGLGGTQSSPVQRLQRKVRNYRRRRKVNKQTPEQTRTGEDTFNSSLQNLWQLFQSSENTDFEFKGFAEDYRI